MTSQALASKIHLTFLANQKRERVSSMYIKWPNRKALNR